MVPAFHLKHLALGYDGTEVLRVPELVIPSGGMVFVIGRSGTGKSTLLESIGLMSDTFLRRPGVKPELHIEGSSFDPVALWDHDREQLARIRRERFSFIFQSTNLMPNFTIGENIRMAAFSHGMDEQATQDGIAALLEALGLPHGTLEKPAHAVSGGQRQRVAFIRALIKDFSVLLADEPTGNLDAANANTLFQVLKNEVTRRKATAVVVTHHLELAERFGDLILDLRIPDNGGAQSAEVHIHRSGVSA
ncbi:MAG: ABC transporter ATP-binding protein [Flavobacteriales bacterium]